MEVSFGTDWSAAKARDLHRLLSSHTGGERIPTPTSAPSDYWRHQTAEELRRHIIKSQFATRPTWVNHEVQRLHELLGELCWPSTGKSSWADSRVSDLLRALAQRLEEALEAGWNQDLFYFPENGWGWVPPSDAKELGLSRRSLWAIFCKQVTGALASKDPERGCGTRFVLSGVDVALRLAWREQVDGGADPLTIPFTSDYIEKLTKEVHANGTFRICYPDSEFSG